MPEGLVTVNGEPRPVADGTTIADLVSQVLTLPASDVTGVAVALDDRVVPRSQWAATAVPAGSRVELVTATQGG